MAKLVNINFKASTQGATKIILPGIARDFNRIFRRNKGKFEEFSKIAVELAIKAHPTYASLVGDEPNSLRAELGLADPLGQVQPILDHWIRSVSVNLQEVRVAGTRLVGGISVQGINDTFRDVTNLPTASFYAERAKQQGITPFLIEWVDWLLLRGNEPLVFGFFVDTDVKSTDNSRTGLAVMRDEHIARLKGITWNVPIEYQGVKNDNWITESVADTIPEIEEYIVGTILPQLGAVQRLR